MLEAAIEARQQGLIGGIGITGHGLQIAATHRRSLDRFDFDSVLLPYNYITMQNDYYAEHFNELQALCQKRNTAVQTIKSIAFQPWMGQPRTNTTWYRPLQSQEDIDMAVWWVLERPGIFLNTTGDSSLLPMVLDAASRFDPEALDHAANQPAGLPGRHGFYPLVCLSHPGFMLTAGFPYIFCLERIALIPALTPASNRPSKATNKICSSARNPKNMLGKSGKVQVTSAPFRAKLHNRGNDKR